MPKRCRRSRERSRKSSRQTRRSSTSPRRTRSPCRSGRDSVVVTTNRIIGFSPGVLGRVSFSDYMWQDVLDVSMKQGMLSTEIVIETAAGKHQVGAIDKQQAKRLYGIAQQLEQEWREK